MPRSWIPSRAALALAIFGVLACAPASAQAQSVEVENRRGGACGPVEVDRRHAVTGGCSVRFEHVRPVMFRERLSGLPLVPDDGCGIDFTANLSEGGTGYFSGQFFSDCLTSCDDPIGAPHPDLEWPVSGIADTGAGRRLLVFTFCFRAPGAGEGSPGFVCTIAAQLTARGRRQQLAADRAPCFEAAQLEVSGRWLSEADPDPDDAILDVEDA